MPAREQHTRSSTAGCGDDAVEALYEAYGSLRRSGADWSGFSKPRSPSASGTGRRPRGSSQGALPARPTSGRSLMRATTPMRSTRISSGASRAGSTAEVAEASSQLATDGSGCSTRRRSSTWRRTALRATASPDPRCARCGTGPSSARSGAHDGKVEDFTYEEPFASLPGSHKARWWT
jgi:hypothetical protein